MKKSILFIVFPFILLLSSCVSQRGDVLVPPKYVEIRVTSGKVHFASEFISYTSFSKPNPKPDDYINDPEAVFRSNPGSKHKLEKEMTLSAGGVYEILVPAKHTANIYIKPVFEDSTVVYKDFLREYTIELSKNDIFGKVIPVEF